MRLQRSTFRQSKTIELNGNLLRWNHCRNLAEKAIQMMQYCVIANIMCCDTTSSVQAWHSLLPQMEMKLSMLHPPNVAPKMMAHSNVDGIHDFNKMSSAPIGCRTKCTMFSWIRRALFVWITFSRFMVYLYIQWTIQMPQGFHQGHKNCMHFWLGNF